MAALHPSPSPLASTSGIDSDSSLPAGVRVRVRSRVRSACGLQLASLALPERLGLGMLACCVSALRPPKSLNELGSWPRASGLESLGLMKINQHAPVAEWH